VATSIPLVLGIVFVCMEIMDITLQRISLGALIIALGLLVDDAMITIEMMVAKLEEGASILKAATAAYTLTAFPMLTGTLVTVAGFVPIGFAASKRWGILPDLVRGAGARADRLLDRGGDLCAADRCLDTPEGDKEEKHGGGHGGGKLERMFRPVSGLVHASSLDNDRRFRHALRRRVARLSLCPAAILPGLGPAGGAGGNSRCPRACRCMQPTQRPKKLEEILKADSDVERYSLYVGGGAIRFYLPLDVQLDNDFFAQAVIVTKGLIERERLIAKLTKAFDTGFDDVLARIHPLEVGPPVGWPIQIRTSGKTTEEARDVADKVAAVIRGYSGAHTVNYDWYERSKSVRIEIDQDRARELGVSSEQIATVTNAIVSGESITQVRDSIYLIDHRGAGRRQGARGYQDPS